MQTNFCRIKIFIGELEIKFLGDTPFKHLELVELQDFDHKLLRKSTQTEERTMPELPVWTIRPNKKELILKSDEQLGDVKQ